MFKVTKFAANSDADSACNELLEKKQNKIQKKNKTQKGKITKAKKKQGKIVTDKLKGEIKCMFKNEVSKNLHKKRKEKSWGQDLHSAITEKRGNLKLQGESQLPLKNKSQKGKFKQKRISQQIQRGTGTENSNILVMRKKKKREKTIQSLIENTEGKTTQNKKRQKKRKRRYSEVETSFKNGKDKSMKIKTNESSVQNIDPFPKDTNTPLSKRQKKRQKVKSKLKKIAIAPTTIQKGKNKELSLRERMMQKLKSARFRYINEQYYSTESKKANTMFKDDPDSFRAYHEGYRLQVSKWPINPLDVIIENIQKLPKNQIIADFGCGDAVLMKSVPHKVHSFDLVAANENVTACDMAHVPLDDSSVDVAVFCLSLMCTNLQDFLLEANRVLKIGGILKIAEVESRFDNVDEFIEALGRFHFKNVWKDCSHNLFYFMDFKKESNIKNKKKLPTVSLHPCLYKKR